MHAAGAHDRRQGHRGRRSPARSNIATVSATPPTSTLTFDRDVPDLQLDAGQHRRACSRSRPTLRSAQRPLRRHLRDRQRQRHQRRPSCASPGTAIETVEAAVLTRDVERNEVLKSSDVVIERRPEGRSRRRRRGARPRGRHADAPADPRRHSRCKVADLAKPELVQRDQNVTLIYEIRRALPHHARQGAGRAAPRATSSTSQPAIQAHGVRRRHRPRPGRDLGRRTAACRSCNRQPPPRSAQPTAIASPPAPVRLIVTSRSKSRVM